MQTILITGVSSGIGQALAEEHIRKGNRVFAIGKSPSKSVMSHINFNFLPLDLSDADMVRNDIREFIVGRRFDLAILNAGIYPETKRLVNITLANMRNIMDIMLWSNKQIIDGLLLHAKIDQIAVMGASPSLFGHKGFGSYAIAKSALETMIRLYAEEYPHTHFAILAPVLIHTPSLSKFLKKSNPELFPHVQIIKDKLMMPLDQALPRLMDAFVEIKRHKSGSFIEMKSLNK